MTVWKRIHDCIGFSIKTKINLSICLLIIVVFIALTISGTISINMVIHDVSRELLFELTEKNIQKLQSNIDTLQNVGLSDSKEFIDNTKVEAIDEIKKFKYKNTGFIYIIDSDGRVVFHPEIETNTNLIDLPYIHDIVDTRKGQVSYTSVNGDAKIGTFAYFPAWKWYLCLEMGERELYNERIVFLKRVISICIISFVLAIAIGLSLGLSISKRLNKIVDIAKDITGGKSDITWMSESSDEIGVLNTSLKSMTESLKSAEKKYRSIYENAVEGIFQSSPQGVLITANPALARMLGYDSPEDLIASIKNLSEQLYVHNHDRDEFKRIIAKNGQIIGFETDFHKKDGSMIYCSISARIIHDASGEIHHYEGTILDITERKEKEKAERERELAEAATRTKSEFLANMSHEIRTPMNAIIGMAHLALKTELTPKQFDYIKKIDTSAKLLLGIINDILDFSKIEAGKLEIESVGFHLEDVLQNLAAIAQPKVEEKELELLFRVAPGVPNTLKGDPLRLGQVLINLTNNAIKFTEKGEVVVFVELIEKLDDNQAMLRFSISDTGIGLTGEQQARLFSAFSQADSSTTRKYGGTGLGLAICKRLVELMGGEIRVESQFGKGSTFFFTLLLGASLQDTRKRTHMVTERLKDMRVLVVDDNETALTLLGDFLTEFSIDPTLARSGEEALDILDTSSKKQPYELVFMDWRMPGMDGIETARRIKANPRIEKKPAIILVTAYGREEVFRQIETNGLEGVLIKPVNQSVVLNTIMEALGR